MLVSNRYPYLEITFRIKQVTEKKWAYIDTGFDGYLIIPSKHSLILGDADYVGRWELGDSSLVESNEYLGEIQIHEMNVWRLE